MNYVIDFFKIYPGTKVLEYNGYSITIKINTDNSPLNFDESHDSVQSVIEDFSIMTAESFGVPLNEKKEGTRRHLQGVNCLAIAHTESELLGFASFYLDRGGFLYLHGIVTSNEAKGRSVAKNLISTVVGYTQRNEIAFTTQNPVMYCLLKSMYSQVYPSVENPVVPENIGKRTSSIMSKRTGTFDEVRGVSRNLYSKCLYERLPISSNETANKWFAEILRCENGQTRDGLCLVGIDYLT